jgi:hypothetical protein
VMLDVAAILGTESRNRIEHRVYATPGIVLPCCDCPARLRLVTLGDGRPLA